MGALQELEDVWHEAKADPQFQLYLAGHRHSLLRPPHTLHAAVRLNKLLGAEVKEGAGGTKTLKDATSEAIRDWVTNGRTTHYIIGSVGGPHPCPEMVRDLQRVIGDEAREQYLSVDGKLPDVVVACVGGGSNAIGIFTAFLDDKDASLVAVEAAGPGIKTSHPPAPPAHRRPPGRAGAV